jgi:hypothetical protein
MPRKTETMTKTQFSNTLDESDPLIRQRASNVRDATTAYGITPIQKCARSCSPDVDVGSDGRVEKECITSQSSSDLAGMQSVTGAIGRAITSGAISLKSTIPRYGLQKADDADSIPISSSWIEFPQEKD